MKIKRNLIDFTTPKVMGILNLNSNSFYEKSRLNSDKQTIEYAEKMLYEGATILDLGVQSTRPGSILLTENEEISKITDALGIIFKNFPETVISIDTFRSSVAKAAIDYGAQIINDISGFSFDPEILNTISKHEIYYVLMHIKGDFETMHADYDYENITQEVKEYFKEKLELLTSIPENQLIIDPGFGFSKSQAQNFDLLNNLHLLQSLEKPLLVGLSRKSMIQKKLGVSAEDALNGTIALNAIALSKGAKILRVHDVKEAVEIVKLVG